MDDIVEVFQNGISFAAFTLTRPNHFDFHPFQKMGYMPASLKGTSYLKTLLAADVLLKEISTGVEINPNFPFEMRPMKESLPNDLKKVLLPLSERKKTRLASCANAHRFWIDVESINLSEDMNEEFYRLEVDDPAVVVRQFPLTRDASGNFIDDEAKAAEEATKESAEAAFAREVTANYKLLENAYPEFGRVKELSKISVIYLMLESRIREMTSVEGCQGRVKWFLNHHNIQKKINDHIKKFYPKCEFKDLCGQERPMARDYFVTILCKQFNTTPSEVTPSFDAWLCGGDRGPLEKVMVDGLLLKHQEWKKGIEKSIGVKIGEPQVTVKEPNPVCEWVPSAFCNSVDNTVIVHGGVRIEPEVRIVEFLTHVEVVITYRVIEPIRIRDFRSERRQCDLFNYDHFGYNPFGYDRFGNKRYDFLQSESYCRPGHSSPRSNFQSSSSSSTPQSSPWKPFVENNLDDILKFKPDFPHHSPSAFEQKYLPSTVHSSSTPLSICEPSATGFFARSECNWLPKARVLEAWDVSRPMDKGGPLRVFGHRGVKTKADDGWCYITETNGVGPVITYQVDCNSPSRWTKSRKLCIVPGVTTVEEVHNAATKYGSTYLGTGTCIGAANKVKNALNPEPFPKEKRK